MQIVAHTLSADGVRNCVEAGIHHLVHARWLSAAGRWSRSGGRGGGDEPLDRASRADLGGVTAPGWMDAARCPRRTKRRRGSAPTPHRERARCRRCPYRTPWPRAHTDPPGHGLGFGEESPDSRQELSVAMSWPEGRLDREPRPWWKRCNHARSWPHSVLFAWLKRVSSRPQFRPWVVGAEGMGVRPNGRSPLLTACSIGNHKPPTGWRLGSPLPRPSPTETS